MMAVVTVASLDGFITVGAGGQMDTSRAPGGCRCRRSSWMIRWSPLAMMLWASSLCRAWDPLLDNGMSWAVPVWSALVGPRVLGPLVDLGFAGDLSFTRFKAGPGVCTFVCAQC